MVEVASKTYILRSYIYRKFAFGDRTIPIHARTLGFDVSPHVMDVYYGTVQSAVGAH